MLWADIYRKLSDFAEHNTCEPVVPPKAIILAGWNFSDDTQKMRRWQETEKWISQNGCEFILDGLTDDDWHYS